jgi:hypothetical protein
VEGASVTDIIVPEPVKKTRFDPSDVPEFHEVAKRTNNHLTSMAKQGVIKYGERGDLKGKVRLDLTKTYDYYRDVLKEDPVVAHVLKLTMDEWRESHTHRRSWVSMEGMFGLSNSSVENLFANRVGCAAKAVAHEKRDKEAWNEYWSCTTKLDKMKRDEEIALGTYHLKQGFTKEKFRDRYQVYMEQYFKRKNISGHIATSLRNSFTKGWDVKSKEAIEVRTQLRTEFFQTNYKDFIADEYHRFVKPDMRNTKQVFDAAVEHRLKQKQEYVETEMECNCLHKTHDQYNKEAFDFRYSSDCKQELDDMRKETQEFAGWMSKEILRNLWRE